MNRNCKTTMKEELSTPGFATHPLTTGLCGHPCDQPKGLFQQHRVISDPMTEFRSVH